MIKITKDPLNIIFSQVHWTDLANLYFAGFARRVVSYINGFRSDYLRKRFIYSNVELFKRSGDDKDVMIYKVLMSCSMEVFKYLHSKYNLSPDNGYILQFVASGGNIEMVQWLFDHKYRFYYYNYPRYSIESIKFTDSNQICQIIDLCNSNGYHVSKSCANIALGYKMFDFADKIYSISTARIFKCEYLVETIVHNGGSIDDVFEAIEWLGHKGYKYISDFIISNVIKHSDHFGMKAVTHFIKWAVKNTDIQHCFIIYYWSMLDNDKKLIEFLYESGIKIEYPCLVEALKLGNINLANWLLPKCTGDVTDIDAYVVCKDPKKQIEVLQWALDNGFAMSAHMYEYFANDVRVLDWLWEKGIPINDNSISGCEIDYLKTPEWFQKKEIRYNLGDVVKTHDIKIVRWVLDNLNKNVLIENSNIYRNIIKASNSTNIDSLIQIAKLLIVHDIKPGKMYFHHVFDKTVIKKWQELSDK
jgi:hypothetical protein